MIMNPNQEFFRGGGGGGGGRTLGWRAEHNRGTGQGEEGLEGESKH